MALLETRHRGAAAVPACVTGLLCWALALVRPLFHDEASTVYFAGSDLSHLFQMLQQDVHPPLYFLFAWERLRMFDGSFLAVRGLSCVFMGLAVFAFLRGIRIWTGQHLTPLAMAAVATSPFLIFCGYFARYYSLACLLWACCFWAAAVAYKGRQTRSSLLFGIFLALLFLTNYAGALITSVGFTPFFIWLIFRRYWVELFAVTAPLLIAIVLWSPVLFAQLSTDLPNRWEDESLISAGRILKNSGFLAWTLAVSDGMPPWSVPGLVSAPLMLLIASAAIGFTYFKGSKSKDGAAFKTLQHLLSGSLLMLLAGVAIGVFLLPGPMYSFLPPRVALAGFAWLFLAVVLPDALFRYRKPVLFLVIVVHIYGLVQMLIFRQSTNWAYQVPAEAIAERTLAIAADHTGPDVVYLPEKSMRNIRYYLDKDLAAQPQSLIVNPKVADSLLSATQVIVIRQTRAEQWPPSDAISNTAVAIPPGNWEKVQSLPYLQEDAAAQSLKARFSDSGVYPDKIRLDVWRQGPAR